MAKPIHRLIFQGKLKPNTDRALCMERLARLFNKEVKDIETRLFSGKEMLIRKTEDQTVVDKYIRAFDKAGAVLQVITASKGSAPEVAPVSKPPRQAHEPKAGSNRHPGRPSSDRKKNRPARKNSPHIRRRRLSSLHITAIILMMIILAGLGGGYFWFRHAFLRADIPQIVIDMENALAMDGLVALGHGNIEKTIALEALFLDEPDNQALIDRESTSIIDKLIKAGIDPRKSVKQLLFAVHVTGRDIPDMNGYATLVLIGHFTPQRIRTFVEREYTTHPLPGNDEVLIFTKQDVDTCQWSPEMAIYADQTRVIITFPGAMDHLLKRIDQKAPADIPLDRFRRYRKDMLASAGLFAPNHLDKAANGFVAMILKQIQQEIEPVQSGFLGVKPQLFPTGVLVDMVVNTRDPHWVLAQVRKLKEMVAQSKSHVPDTIPSLLKLYDHVTIGETGNQLNMSLLLNTDLFDNMGEALGELMGAVFAGASGPGDQQDTVSEEMVEKSPMPFSGRYGLSDLIPFDAVEDMNFRPDWTGGPFGLYVDRIAYTGENDIEVSLQAEARQIKNLGKGAQRISLRVTSATDSEGNEWLKEETCGEDRNDQPAYFKNPFTGTCFKDGKMIFYRKYNAEKRVRLKKDAPVADISQLRGTIRLDLPTETESILVQAPVAGKVIQDDHVRLRFNDGGPSKIAYDISGRENHVLAVRALNREKKVLTSSGGFSMGRLWGNGKSVSTDIRGTIGFVEVILAKTSVTKAYPFLLNTIVPVQSSPFAPHSPMPIETLTLEDFDKTYKQLPPPVVAEKDGWRGAPQHRTALGPFMLELYGFASNNFWGTRGSFSLYAPPIPSLNKNLSAMGLVIDEVIGGNGQSVPISYSDAIALEYAGGYRENGVFHPDPEKNYLKGMKDFQLDYKGEAPRGIKGKLILRLPAALSQVAMDNLSLGRTVSGQGYRLRVTGIGRGLMEIAIGGDRDRILGFDLFDADRQALNAYIAGLENMADAWKARITYTGTPFRLVMHIAEITETREMPFQISLP